jgi:hypothetical protein
MAKDVGITIGPYFSMLTENLGMQGVSAKYMSQLLTVEQKEN